MRRGAERSVEERCDAMRCVAMRGAMRADA